MPISGAATVDAAVAVAPDKILPARSVLAAAVRVVVLGLGPIVGLVVALWAAAGSPGTLPDAARVGALIWTLALGGPLAVGDVRLGVVPLGLTLALAVLPWREGRRLVALPRSARARAVVGLAVLCGGSAAGVAAAGSAPTLSGSPLAAGAGAALLTLVAAGAGAARRQPWATPGRSRRSTRAEVVRASGAAVRMLLVGGALLLLVGLAAAVGDVLDASSRLGAGPGPVVLQAVYLPDAVVWATAFLLGPGVAVGAGATVSPFGVGVPHLLPLPLVEVLPQPGYAPGLALFSLVVPWVAGAVAARRLLRRLPARVAPRRAAVLAALCGPVSAVPVGVLAWFVSGPAGTDVLGRVGPSPLAVALACAVQVGAAAAVTAALAVATRPPAPASGVRPPRAPVPR